MLDEGSKKAIPVSNYSHTEDWRQLAEQASKEKDPKKLLVLVQALCRTLEERDTGRKGPAKP